MKKIAVTVAVLALGLAACDARTEENAVGNEAAVENAAAEDVNAATVDAGNAAENALDAASNQIEDAGENEILNWLPLAGAMHEARQKPAYCEFMESYLMNSCKCVAIFPPRRRWGTRPAVGLPRVDILPRGRARRREFVALRRDRGGLRPILWCNLRC